jgi:hypothetical protein
VRLALKCHPDTPCAAVTRIEVEVARAGQGALALRYVLSGAIGDLVIPPPAAPARTDELWRRTCFEAFVRPEPGKAYYEFNHSPSTQWAAYRFSGYRDGMAPADIAAPHIDLTRAADRLELRAHLALPDFADAPWRLGLSAVIEETNGAKSYWALAHPTGRPDFHHAHGFAATLAQP